MLFHVSVSVGICIYPCNFESCLNLNYSYIIFIRGGMACLVSSVFQSRSFTFAAILSKEPRLINYSQVTGVWQLPHFTVPAASPLT